MGIRLGIGRRIRPLGRNRKGFAAVEFALALPVVLLGVAAVIDLSSVLLVVTLIEGGLRDAARFGITGYIPPGTTREQQILERIAANTHGLVDMGTSEVTTLIYPSFDDIGQPEPFVDASPFNGVYDVGEDFTDINGNGQWDADMGAAGLGGPGDVVLYSIEVDWHALTPIARPFLGDNGKMRLKASVAVRNEPFPLPGGGS